MLAMKGSTVQSPGNMIRSYNELRAQPSSNCWCNMYNIVRKGLKVQIMNDVSHHFIWTLVAAVYL